MLLLCSVAAADPETEQLREQLRATVLQLRQLQDQQAVPPPPAAAPAADAASKARLAALQAQLRVARSRAAKADQIQADLDKARADNATMTAAATASAAEIAALKSANIQAADEIRALSMERDHVKAQLIAMTAIAKTCQTKNDRLAALSTDLATRLTRVSMADVMAREEPFLGLARTRLENLTQDREDAVRAARCNPAEDATPANPVGHTLKPAGL
jgi:DNA repair exonuclease SbcCD ATPase subunit